MLLKAGKVFCCLKRLCFEKPKQRCLYEVPFEILIFFKVKSSKLLKSFSFVLIRWILCITGTTAATYWSWSLQQDISHYNFITFVPEWQQYAWMLMRHLTHLTYSCRLLGGAQGRNHSLPEELIRDIWSLNASYGE